MRAQLEPVARVVVEERLAAHRLVAPRDDDGRLSREYLLCTRDDRLEAGRAEPVHVHRRHRRRQPGGEGAAARVVGVGPDLADLAHHDLVDLARVDARSRDRLADARRAELVRVDVLERAAEASDRGAHTGHEHDRIAVCHHVVDATGALGAGGALRAPTKHRRPVRGERCSGMQAHLIDRGGAQDVGVDRALLERLAGEKGFWWLDLHGPTDELLGLLGEVFGFHPLAIEDAMNFGQRPKLDEYDDVVFLVVYGAAPDEDDLVEVHCFYSERYLVTVRRDDCPAFAEARERHERRPDRLGEPALVLYRVVDGLVDSFFPLLTTFDEFIDAVEEGIFTRPDQEQLRRIFLMKRRLVGLRRVIAPERDLVASIASGVIELPGASAESERSFRDVYDHLIRLTDTIDSYRDLLTGASRRVPLDGLEPAERRDQAAGADRDDLPAAHLHHRLLRAELQLDGRRGRRRDPVLGARRRPPAAGGHRAARVLQAPPAGSERDPGGPAQAPDLVRPRSIRS